VQPVELRRALARDRRHVPAQARQIRQARSAAAPAPRSAICIPRSLALTATALRACSRSMPAAFLKSSQSKTQSCKAIVQQLRRADLDRLCMRPHPMMLLPGSQPPRACQQ
jgi:hypothetical protein